MTKRLATEEQITELANSIANQAEAIANRNTTADIHAVTALLLGNVKTLFQWTLVDNTGENNE